MPTPSTLRLDADWVRVVVNPDDTVAMDLQVPVGSETGTWSLKIYADERRLAALVNAAGSTSPASTPTAPKIRFTVSSTDNDGLVGPSRSRFHGIWEMRHAESERKWMRGDWIVNGGFEQ